MTSYKKQHYVPASYLRAWCDQKLPKGHQPFVWRFSKDGTQKSKKAPKNIFYERDIYTIFNDGDRDLKYEANLSKLEDEFIKIRRRKLAKRISLTPDEFFTVCTFVAAMSGRTKKKKEHWANQWSQVLNMAERVQEAFENKSTPSRANDPKIERRIEGKNEIPIEEVRKLAKNPILSLLPDTISYVAPILFRMPSMIIDTDGKERFITSDAPCVWYDPAMYKTPKPYGAGGLKSPTLEITLPISPTQMIIYGKELLGWARYIVFNDTFLIDNLNKRTRLFSQEFFVSNTDALKSSWF